MAISTRILNVFLFVTFFVTFSVGLDYLGGAAIEPRGAWQSVLICLPAAVVFDQFSVRRKLAERATKHGGN